jgi:DNA-binding beta-propeller fold protein YncE
LTRLRATSPRPSRSADGPSSPSPTGARNVFVNLDDKSEIAVIDAREMTVKRRWPLAPGDSPSGLAIDAKNHRLFSVCENQKMIVMNADTGKVIAALPGSFMILVLRR